MSWNGWCPKCRRWGHNSADCKRKPATPGATIETPSHNGVYQGQRRPIAIPARGLFIRRKKSIR